MVKWDPRDAKIGLQQWHHLLLFNVAMLVVLWYNSKVPVLGNPIDWDCATRTVLFGKEHWNIVECVWGWFWNTVWKIRQKLVSYGVGSKY